MRNFSKLNIDLRGHTSGHVKTFCPFCHEQRHDKRDKSLSVDIDKGLYKCHYCDAQGYVPDEDEERRKEERRRRREQKQNQLPQKGQHTRPDWHPEFLTLAPQILQYFASRGLTRETLYQAKVTSPWTELFSPSRPTQVIAFNYFDHHILINVKYRTLDKEFRLVPKAELIPYNVDAILRKEICYITEGEFDCLTLIQCGFPESISVPNGAQKNLAWMDRFVETHFDDKTRIILALDNDEKGRMLKDELLRRLGEERCRLVTWSDDCKDANEELMKHGAESVRQRVERAAEIPLSGIQTVEDVESSLDELFLNGKQHGAAMQLGGMDRLITFETGRYMVTTGRPGDGKKRRVEMNDINGSADFGNMTDFCIAVDRDDDLKVVSIYVDKVKFKHLGTRGVFHFHYDELSGRYVPCELERVPGGIEVAEGPVPGRPGTLCVRSAGGVKYYKTTDWRYFNVRWVDENGEAHLPNLPNTQNVF